MGVVINYSQRSGTTSVPLPSRFNCSEKRTRALVSVRHGRQVSIPSGDASGESVRCTDHPGSSCGVSCCLQHHSVVALHWTRSAPCCCAAGPGADWRRLFHCCRSAMLGRTNRLRTIWEQQLRTPAGRPAGEGFESAAEGWLTCGRVRCVQNRHLHLQQLQDLSWPRRDLHPRRWQGKSCHYDILFATQRAGCESEDRGLGVRRALDRETNRCTLPSGFRHIQWTDSAAAVMQARGRPSAGVVTVKCR